MKLDVDIGFCLYSSAQYVSCVNKRVIGREIADILRLLVDVKEVD